MDAFELRKATIYPYGVQGIGGSNPLVPTNEI